MKQSNQNVRHLEKLQRKFKQIGTNSNNSSNMGMEHALLKMYRNKQRMRSKLREMRTIHQETKDTIEVMDERYAEL